MQLVMQLFYIFPGMMERGIEELHDELHEHLKIEKEKREERRDHYYLLMSNKVIVSHKEKIFR